MEHAEIRVRGRVQGVGFRPTVWRLARDLGLSGDVRNDAQGVLIRVSGEGDAIAGLIERLREQPPPLARIEHIEQSRSDGACALGFRIIDSAGGTANTEVSPDAAICDSCRCEVLDARERRHAYAFANCTHCGPRFSITRRIPYDRAGTTMAPFTLCVACAAEYRNPADRRFHAEAIACPECGPRLNVALATAAAALQDGQVVAIKGIGGYQLACDATNGDAVARLRAAKHRETKPFALMARDLAVIRRYCLVNEAETHQLAGAEAPVVLLRTAGRRLPEAVAPGLRTLGCMLPTTPLHLLLLQSFDVPLVMTSGNLSDEPQIIDDAEARERLQGIADLILSHDRAIALRVDDSVVRVMSGVPRVLRRGRGFAPSAITMPAGFEAAPDLLAAGGELKNTICLLKDGRAILSQHIGDLGDARTFDDYRGAIAHYTALFDHVPVAIAADRHPDYLSSKWARNSGVRVIEVQHHHAHIASCLAESGRALNAPPVLGIVLDGLGWGDDGTIWGGEFLLTNYHESRRVGWFKPVAMPGGTTSVREPWRNLYAHLRAAGLPQETHAMLETMIRSGTNSPLASSCGRLFDAMAAALGICRKRQGHEGEAAARLEALVCAEHGDAYPFAADEIIDPAPMWRAVLGDLHAGVPHGVMAARFHNGLAAAVVEMAQRLARRYGFDAVALSGGCFQNAVLFELIEQQLCERGFHVLSHSLVPANDGGLALGQVAVAAAQLLAG